MGETISARVINLLEMEQKHGREHLIVPLLEARDVEVFVVMSEILDRLEWIYPVVSLQDMTVTATTTRFVDKGRTHGRHHEGHPPIPA